MQWRVLSKDGALFFIIFEKQLEYRITRLWK